MATEDDQILLDDDDQANVPAEDADDAAQEMEDRAAVEVPEDQPVQTPAAAQAAEYGAEQNLAEPGALPEGGEEFLQRLGAKVVFEAELDYQSFAGWREKKARHLDIYNANLPDNIPDQPNITPMHLPMGKRAVRMFKSKMYPALFPASGEYIALKVQNPALEEIAARCTVHLNLKLSNECVEYAPSHDRGMTQDLIEGSIFEVWYWDPILGRARNEVCLAEDCWISYKSKSDRPDLADVPRITWRVGYHQHQLEELEDAGYYTGITTGDRPMFPPETSYDKAGTPMGSGVPLGGILDDKPIKEAQDEFTGAEKSHEETDPEHEFLEQDRMVRLPGERRQRAVTVCVNRTTQRVHRLVLREMEDRRDRRRYDREIELHVQQVQSLTVQHEQATRAWQAAQAPVEAGVDELGLPIYAPNPQAGLQPQPETPKMPEAPKPLKRVPWNRWTRIDCDVNPEGALGNGVLDDVAGHNVLADKISTRAVSLLTLSMLPTGLISRHSRFARGEVSLKLGAFNEVSLSPIEVERGAGIHQLQFNAPDPQWVKFVELADKSAQDVTAFDIAMGAPGKSGETATESDNRHSSATANISVIASRYNRGRAVSIKNLAYILSQTLPPEGEVIYMSVPAPPPEPQVDPMTGQPMPAPPPGPQQMQKIEVRVTREDYDAILDELQVTFTCDPEMESKAMKERRAMKMWQTALQLATTQVAPGLGVLPPETTLQIMRAVASKVFDALDMPKEMTAMIMAAPMPQLMQPPQPGGPNEGAAGGGRGMDGQGPAGVPGQPGGSAGGGGAGAPPPGGG